MPSDKCVKLIKINNWSKKILTKSLIWQITDGQLNWLSSLAEL